MDKIDEPVLSILHLSVTFANGNGGLEAVQDISFDLYNNEFVCVLGPSGSGKSTLLRVLAGLVKPSEGKVNFTGAWHGCQPKLGYVSQLSNLMPWRTAFENILLPLELQGVKAEEAHTRAQEMISLTGLQGFEDTWPGDLSGGMAQRVSIARALVQEPDMLLLDEPFGALDALTRERMGAELLEIWQARRTTVLMVTHSISEALLLADRVLVFTQRPGRILLDMQVPLQRPRSEDIRYTMEFMELGKKLKGMLG